MRPRIILLALFVFLTSQILSASAQTSDATVKPSLVSGEVQTVSDGKMVLQTKDGAVDVVLSGKTEYKRVSPDNPSLKTATAAAFSDIEVGDKIAVTGIMATDKKSIPARSVYLMTKSDIASKQTKDQELWKRGVSGQVAAINPVTKEITVTSRGFTGETKIVLTPKDNAAFRRYAPNSVSYGESKTSSISEISVGDSIRARGEKSEDGATLKADEIVSGSFQTVAGAITAIDAAKNEITISDIKTKKPLTVVVGQNTVIKQFPAEMAQRMAAFQSGAGGMRPPQANGQTGGQTNGQANQPPTGQTPPNGGGMRPGGGGGMRGGGGIDEMLERFPTITLADLKVGQMIAFSSTKGTSQERVTAIKLLSGVEPFLTAPKVAGGGGRRAGGADSGFSIPGLDGGF